ncbi:MAG: hypothetical protein ABIH26_04195 [Candidatus Eisenbacteria bacterium]
MKREPFFTGQILEIAVGERYDNRLYRAQVAQADNRHLVLHVPGFDPLGFVDLLKGTGVTLRTTWKGEPHLGASKLAEHFKDSSPYLVIRRPSSLAAVRREASARVRADLDAKYVPRAEPPIRAAEPEDASGESTLALCGVPEPFDPGTHLRVELEDEGRKPLILEGRVRHVRRDPEEASRYIVDLAIEGLDTCLEQRLLRMLLRPRDEGTDCAGDNNLRGSE